MEEQRRCLACGEPIYGRADKKFCSDACRNSYHYEQKQKQKESEVVRKVNATLARNYKTLTSLNDKGKSFVSRKQLIDAGFDFKVFTGIYTTKTGSTYYLVYDQAYLKKEGDENMYLLVEFKEKKA